MNTPPDLASLRDIHLPPSPSWWPPAPGWWLLGALVLVGLSVLARMAWRRQRERRWRRRVHAELERIGAMQAHGLDTAALASAVSQLLRRVARVIDPAAASLRAEDWLAFLDRQWPLTRAEREPFQRGIGRVLIDAPYRRADDPAQAFDARALLDLARHWLAAALPRRREHA